MKFFLDFAPLVLFFVVFRQFGLLPATASLIITSLLSAGWMYFSTKKIPTMLLVTTAVVVFFGGLTLFFHDERFIKVKPTIVNLVFAAILLIGVLRNQGLLKHLFGDALPLKAEAWKPLSLRYGLFFLSLAILNEIVWRHTTTEQWVTFKVFGLIALSVAFTASQIGFFKRHLQEQAS